MSKILFNNTIIETTSSAECTSGLNVIFTIYPSEVSNTVIISKSSNIGRHVFTDASFDSVTGISNVSKTFGEKLILTFDYDTSVANQAVVVTSRILIAEAKLSVFKAELGVNSEIILSNSISLSIIDLKSFKPNFLSSLSEKIFNGILFLLDLLYDFK